MQVHQAIMGDLNTMANGVSRLHPFYCCDKMRLLSLGWSEGAYWAHHVFAVRGSCGRAVTGAVAGLSQGL